ncbi:hypothetical protein [Roseimaritima ulvae]|uniref:Periplasmic heavy metal sensor n=1 Tax=Roseimaritima ulvae TaxID=980254 RepID=A0A5B9QX54_9BACT|nr:hypothetical protein [Roseimaritima ulvae]QEG41696.1 hypothetical protein UC8_37220 [Roseimaritima ulvae]
MKCITATLLTICLLSATRMSAQDRFGEEPSPPSPASKSDIANPFEDPPSGGAGFMGAEGDMGMGMEMMDMDMEMGMGMGSPISSAEQFRRRLKTAIKRIGSAKNQEEKAALLKYTETALQNRYDEMIAGRKQDLERLKKRLQQLENDLQRREAAKDRVVELQMQSAILAAEGLLDINTLQPSSGRQMGMESGYGME